MQFDPCAFNTMIGDMGQDVLWYRANQCPCVNQHSGASRHTCKLCHGVGRFFDDPRASRIGVASQRIQKQWATFGVYEQGDMVCSIPSDSPMYDMGHGDRVVMLNAQDQFQVVLQRGLRDSVKPFEVARIARVFWLGQDDKLVEGGIPEVSKDGTLTFTTGAPPAGKTYTVVGYKRPDYHCWGEMPSDRGFHGGVALPRRVVLRAGNIAQR